MKSIIQQHECKVLFIIWHKKSSKLHFGRILPYTLLKIFKGTLRVLPLTTITLVNVYVDLVVCTRIAGTS